MAEEAVGRALSAIWIAQSNQRVFAGDVSGVRGQQRADGPTSHPHNPIHQGRRH